jgi:hypothetical protein
MQAPMQDHSIIAAPSRHGMLIQASPFSSTVATRMACGSMASCFAAISS